MNVKFNNFTLDIDSSVMTRYGEQEGAKKGYNPAKLKAQMTLWICL